VTCIVLAINFTIQFGYYGLWLWFPELFNQLENYYKLHPNVSVSVCEVVGHNVTAGGDLQPSPLADCGTRGPPENQVFLNSFIISISAAPANLWTIYHMDKLGRKFFLVFSMLLSGCSAGLIYMVDSAASNLFVSCLFGAVSTMGFNSLDCLSIELFPTSLRGTAMAVTLVSARLGAIIGNIVFGYFVNTYCSLPILSVAVLLIGGGLLGLFLPNTTLQPLL
jgi:VNT family MFS transporter (synaptic vesicle glycoprotein 2)